MRADIFENTNTDISYWYDTIAKALGNGNIPSIELVLSTLRYVPMLSGHESIKQLIDRNKWLFIRYFERDLKTDDVSFKNILTDINVLKKTVDWKELDNFWEDYKEDVIRKLLQMLTDDEDDQAAFNVIAAIDHLRSAKLNYRHELDVIRKAAEKTLLSTRSTDIDESNGQIYIKHIADKIKELIEQDRLIQVGYELQKLSYTKESDVYEGMQHIAEDLAHWFGKLAEKSPNFAVDELYRLFTYTGKLYPELKVALENQKDAVVRNILSRLAAADDDEMTPVMRQVKHLMDMGIDWIELKIVYRSIPGSALKETDNEAEQVAAMKKDGWAIQYIKNPSEAVQLAAVNSNGWAIKHIPNPSEAVQLAAVKKNGLAIKHIPNPSEAVQLAAVKTEGDAIQYIKNPSEAVQLAAVKQDGSAIKFIKNPSEEMQLAAVKQAGWTIKYIKNPSEEMQLAAVKQDGWAIEHITNPSVKLWADEQIKNSVMKRLLELLFNDDRYYVNDGRLLFNYLKQHKCPWQELDVVERSLQPDKMIREALFSAKNLPKTERGWISAVSKDPYLIQHNPNPSEAVQLEAVKNRPYAIDYIKDPSETVQLAAVTRNGIAIQFIKNPSEAVQLAAVNQIGNAIVFISNPSEAVQLAAVKKSGTAIQNIKNPSEVLQLAAVNQFGGAILFISNPSEAVQLAAVKKDGLAIQYIKNPSVKLWSDEQIKHSVMKLLLELLFGDYGIDEGKNLFNYLRKHRCPWPELDTVENHLGKK